MWSSQTSVASVFVNSEHSYLPRLIVDEQMLFHTLGICAWVVLEPIIWPVMSWETVSCVVVPRCCFIVTETKLFSFVPADVWTFEQSPPLRFNVGLERCLFVCVLDFAWDSTLSGLIMLCFHKALVRLVTLGRWTLDAHLNLSTDLPMFLKLTVCFEIPLKSHLFPRI